MSEVRLADALARLEEHHTLHLPLRKRDLLGRLALRFLWRRHVKWQMDVNLAARDAIKSIQELSVDQQTKLGAIVRSIGDGTGLVTSEQLNRELAELRKSDQSVTAGLNQRIYAAVGGLRGEISELRLQMATTQEESADTELRLKTIEGELARVASAAKDAAMRQAQLDLLTDQLQPYAGEQTDIVAKIPDRAAFIEMATAALLDGPTEQARARRLPYLPLVEAARGDHETGKVFDMSPGRGEWLEALRTAGIPVDSASPNPYVVRHCATLGFELAEQDPLEALAGTDGRSLAAITAFRFVERIDTDSLARFVDLTATTLRPGGVLIIETPHVTRTAGEDFHLDPFARRPVHSDFLRFLVEAAGFASTEVRYVDDGPVETWAKELHPSTGPAKDRYCLVAWR